MAESTPSPTALDNDNNVRGSVFVGEGNVYANIDGVLVSTPLHANGSFSRHFGDDWGEVESVAERIDEITAARQALGLPAMASARPQPK